MNFILGIYFVLVIPFWSNAQSQCGEAGVTFTFDQQSDIDSFQSNYPGCTEILGNVLVTSLNVTNLDGLMGLKSIGGNLEFWDIRNLQSLNGLDSLTSIGGDLEFTCSPLFFDYVLPSFAGLENLTSIDGNLIISYCFILHDLKGLDCIDYSSINGLFIQNNPTLSVCNIKSVCDYLDNGGIATISDNDPGCNSVGEVNSACAEPVENSCIMVSVDKIELSEGDLIGVFPNPVQNNLQIKIGNLEKYKVDIRNAHGKLISSQTFSGDSEIDLSGLPSGIYFLEFNIQDQFSVKRIVKE